MKSELHSSEIRLIVLLSNRMTSGIHALYVDIWWNSKLHEMKNKQKVHGFLIAHKIWQILKSSSRI